MDHHFIFKERDGSKKYRGKAMKIILSKKSIFLACLLVGGIYAVPVKAVEYPVDITIKETADEYQLDDRYDPFLPFISTGGSTNIIDLDIPKDTPFPDGAIPIEPEQLKLVIILFTPVGPRALAEDSTGKGHILSENRLIGRNGRITKIADGRVLITDTAITKSGRTITTDKVMRLKKEGDK
ncbi:MAG: hypothetical protein D3923_15565 [Candidatus Electrothrix sp. AR3]|nr:hypothetical protein [Candidatus Electrothrix sp. AR3]